MKRLPLFTLLFSACALAIHASHALTTALEFDRAAILHGELWRVLTGHFTHFSADHLKWDVIAFLAFGSLAELRSRRLLLTMLAAAALTVSLGVIGLQPQFTTYRGLSGLDSALFAFVTADLLLTGWRERDRLNTIIGSLALSGFLAKCGYELVTGRTLFVSANVDFKAVPLAHLLGAVCGVVCALRLRPEGRARCP